MHTRPSTIIAGGVTVAILGALLVFAYGRSVSSEAAPTATATAYVATADIPAGTKWEDAAGHVEQARVPETVRPASAVTDDNRPAGRTSVRAISQGEVITTTQFGTAGTAPAAGLEIPPGHNAVTVNLAVPQGMARYAQPGDLVNIYVTFKGGVQDAPLTKLLKSNVQVLHNRPAGASEQGGGEILLTLALTPGDAEQVIFAKENGSLWFGLVPAGDEPAVTPGRNFTTVLH